MDVTLSIVSHEHGMMLPHLLRDLDAIESLKGVLVIVTLNMPEPVPDASMYPNLRLQVLQNEIPRGFGANHNAAFRHCSTRWFAVLNPDLRIPSGHDPFHAMVSNAEADEKLALVVPTVFNSQAGIEDSVRTNLSPWSILTRRFKAVSAAFHKPGGFEWYAGMCMMFRSSVFQTVGGFDEGYFLYCEDFDICARLHLRGYAKKHVTDSYVIHDAQHDSHSSAQYFFWHLRSLFRVWTSRPFWQIAMGSGKPSKITEPKEGY